MTSYKTIFDYILERKLEYKYSEVEFTNIYFSFLIEFSNRTLGFELPISKFQTIVDVNDYLINWVETSVNNDDREVLMNLLERFGYILDNSKLNLMDIYYRVMFRFSVIVKVGMDLDKDFDKFLDNHVMDENEVSLTNIGVMYLDLYDLLVKHKSTLSNKGVIQVLSKIGDTWFETIDLSIADFPEKLRNIFTALYDSIKDVHQKSVHKYYELRDLEYKYYVNYNGRNIVDSTHIYLRYCNTRTKKTGKVFLKKLETIRNY